MGVFADIEKALQGQVNSITGTPKIQWENDDSYVPVLGTRYWRVTNLPVESALETAGKLVKHTGIYQVDIFVPSNKGLATVTADMDKIYTVFNSLLWLDKNGSRIYIKSVGRGRVENEKNGWCKGFIVIYYECYAH